MSDARYYPIVVGSDLFVDKSRVLRYGPGEPVSEHLHRFGPFNPQLYSALTKYCAFLNARTTAQHSDDRTDGRTDTEVA